MKHVIEEDHIFIETLVSEIQDNLLNEKRYQFPEFPLKEGWSAIVWDEWHTTIEESEESDEGNDIISPIHFELLADIIFERCGAKQCWLIDTEPFVDSDGGFLKRNFTKVDLTWKSFNLYHRLFDFAPFRFYLVDESLTWFIYVDESVLVAGDPQFMNLLVKKMGGYQTLLTHLNSYASEDANTRTKRWVSNIIKRFKEQNA
ncbi:MAG: hypothetical protein ACI8WB_002358 [Phenylobacterium sp.]|jgi:hypothetical protein